MAQNQVILCHIGVSPQRVIKLGDSYCWDLWCMGIDKVKATFSHAIVKAIVVTLGSRMFGGRSSLSAC